MGRTCCPCKRGRDVIRVGGELVMCRCPCDHATIPTLAKTIKRVESGMCSRCGQRPPVDGRRRCESCVSDQKRWNANLKRVEKTQDRVARAAVGLS